MSLWVWGLEDTAENGENTLPHFSNFAQAGLRDVLTGQVVKTTTASLNELFLSTSYIINSFNLHNTPTRQVLLLCIM